MKTPHQKMARGNSARVNEVTFQKALNAVVKKAKYRADYQKRKAQNRLTPKHSKPKLPSLTILKSDQ